MSNFVFGWIYLALVFSTWTAASSKDIFSLESKQFSNDISRRINPGVKPCDDFYGYSCFNPTKQNSTMGVVEAKVSKSILNRLKNGTKPGDGEAVKKYYDLYNQCTKLITKKTKNQAILYLLYLLDSLFDSNDYNHKIDAAQLAKVTAYLLVKHGVILFTELGKSKPVYKRFSKFRRVVSIEAPKKLSHDVQTFFDPKVTGTIKKFLRTHYAQTNPTADEKYLNKIVSDMYNLEFAIAQVVLVPQKIENLQMMTVSEAMKALPTVDWRIFVTSLAGYSGVNLLNGTKLDDYPLLFDNINITKSILAIIAKTPPALLRSYLKTRLVGGMPPSCEDLTTETLTLVKQYLYITDLYSTAAERTNFKRFATKTVDNIIAGARKMLEEVSWIKNDKQMYAGATAKMNKLTKIVGYPNGFDNQTRLDRLHADFALSANETLISLYRKSSKFLAKSILDNRVVRNLDVTAVNANYAPSSNKIVIPVAMLQLVSPNYVPAAIYGSIGAVIGHEIFHGFDVYGSGLDGDGYINPWMSKNGKVSFDSMAKCVINEYNQFNATDGKGKTFKVNGKRTVGENIADYGGLQAAYNAFLSDPNSRKPFPRTPKLKNITNEQLFFLAFNRYYCMPSFDASIASRFPHLPHKVRVLGTLRNFEPFRKAFNCPANSQYAPEKHCNVFAPLEKTKSVAPSKRTKSAAQSLTFNVAAFTMMSIFFSLFAL